METIMDNVYVKMAIIKITKIKNVNSAQIFGKLIIYLYIILLALLAFIKMKKLFALIAKKNMKLLIIIAILKFNIAENINSKI